jgi:class 3 adenylate cyclase/CHASE3 domain sensor protein
VAVKDWLPQLMARVPATVHVKLLGAFLVIVALLITVGAVGLQMLSGVSRRSEDLIKLHRKTAAYRQLQHDTTWQLYSITSALSSPDDRMLESALLQLNQFRYDLERVQFVSKDEVELFGKIQEEHGRLIQVVTQMVELTRAGKVAEGLKLRLTQAGPVADRLERLTNEMVNRAEASMVAKIDESNEAFMTSRWVVIGFAVGSIGLALLLGYAISWSLIGPVKKMDKQFKQIASGDFSKRVEVPNRDEMGALATNLNRMNEELGRLYDELEVRNRFIRETFGRYLSDEVVDNILETPDGLKLGGEKRNVTIMMSDLRGFTSLSQSLEPEQVVRMLNGYFEVMVDIIQQYNGTINEIIGDSLLVIFGAPQEIPDRAQRAIACAIAMQNAMAKVNKENRAFNLPELEMGIGLHDTEVIVGNIGSSKRIKYSVVGSGVNMASRIESYTVGGQVLISESVRQEADEVLRVDDKKEVMPKGAEVPLIIYEAGGIAGQYNLALEREEPAKVTLVSQIPLKYKVLGGKHVGKKGNKGHIVKLSKKGCEADLKEPIALLTNIKMNLGDVDDELAAKDFYGKVIEQSETQDDTYLLRFTAVPPEISSYFQALRQYAAKGISSEKV